MAQPISARNCRAAIGAGPKTPICNAVYNAIVGSTPPATPDQTKQAASRAASFSTAPTGPAAPLSPVISVAEGRIRKDPAFFIAADVMRMCQPAARFNTLTRAWAYRRMAVRVSFVRRSIDRNDQLLHRVFGRLLLVRCLRLRVGCDGLGFGLG